MIFLPGYSLQQLIYASPRTKVYRATKTVDSAAVIVKVPRKLCPSALDIQKLYNQLAIARALDLPEIVQPLGVEKCGSRWILVMRDEQLISLSEYLEQYGYFEQVDANFWAIALQLIKFITKLHQQSWAAKNIDLSNILIDKDQKIKIADLSLASFISIAETDGLNSLSQSSAVLNSGCFEQDKFSGTTKDIYDFGVVIFQLLTGQKPCFSLSTPQQFNYKIPLDLNNLIVKILTEPHKQTAEQIEYKLQKMLVYNQKIQLPSFIIQQNVDKDKFILDSVYANPNPTFVTNLRRELIEVNQSFLKAFGLETEPLFEQIVLDLKTWLKINKKNRYNQSIDKNSNYNRLNSIQLQVKTGEIKTFLVESKTVELKAQTCTISTLKPFASVEPPSKKLQLIKRAIASGTGISPSKELRLRPNAATNQDILSKSLACLTELLNFPLAILTEIVPSPTLSPQLKILGIKPEQFLEQRINLNDSPWQQLSIRSSVKFFDGLLQLFPNCQLLSHLSVSSFVGVAIYDSYNRLIGHLAVLDTQPLRHFSADDELILTMFAARLGAEIERQHLSKQLQQQNNFWHNILDSLPHLIAVGDRRDKIIVANQALADFYGTTIEQIQSQTLATLEPQLKPGIIYKPDFPEDEQPKCWYRVEQICLSDLDSLRLLVATDITESCQIKANLVPQLSQAQLLETITKKIRSNLDTEEIFKTAAQQIGFAFGVNRCLIFAYNLSGKVQVNEYVSGADWRIGKQWHPESLSIDRILTGDRAIAINCVDPSLNKSFDLHQQFSIKSLMAVRTAHNGQFNGLIVLHQCDYERVWQPQEIELLEAVAIQLGITLAQAKLLETEKQQRQQLSENNRTLIEAKQALETASRIKSEFLAHMSHELRTPLNAIIGFSQLMLQESQLCTRPEYVTAIHRSGKHLLGLINNVLEMSKIEAGKAIVNPNSFNLNQLLIDVSQMLSLKADAKGIALNIDSAPEITDCLRTDESKIRQILINLLDNGIKFTETGSVTLKIDLVPPNTNLTSEYRDSIAIAESDSAIKNMDFYDLAKTDCNKRDSSTQIRFTIKDTGIGIASDEINSLFQPFSQTKAGQKAQGTGLGLAISRKFIQLLGGQIRVKSQPNVGTTFWFSIPLQIGEPSLVNNITQQVIGIAPDQPKLKILVAEDRQDNRALLVKALTSVGFQVQSVVNGAEAVKVWQKWQPDLIWMDMRMPVMDGIQATQRIRQIATAASTSSPVIIAITASAFEDRRSASLVAGCDDFVSKPLHLPIIFSKIKQHLSVNYIYAQKTFRQKGNRQNQSSERVSLKSLSPQWQENLRQSAIALDEATILTLVAEIQAVNPTVANHVAKLAKTCRFDLILQLIENNEPAKLNFLSQRERER